MKYQAIKHNKTGSRALGMYATITEAHKAIQAKGGRFWAISYLGGFPTFKDDKNKIYSIQGYAEPWGVVCSVPQKEVEALQLGR